MIAHRTLQLALVSLLIFLAVTGCAPRPVALTNATPAQASAITATAAAPTTKTALKVAVSSYLAYAPFFIAQAEGYFAEEGLDVELVQVARTTDAIAALAQGQLDVSGFPIGSALLNAIVRDSGIKIVASKEQGIAQKCAYSGLVVRKGVALSGSDQITAAKLKGLRYDVNVTAASGYVLDTLLHQYGLALADITLAAMPNAATTLEAMQEGTIDVAAMNEPWITRVRAAGAGDIWLSRGDVAPNIQLAIVAYGPSILKKNPEAGERFMVAYLKGVRRFAQGMTEETLAIVEPELKLDRTLLIQMCPPYIPPDGAINSQSIVDFGKWAAANGLIDAPVTTEMFWEPRFVEYARRVLK